MSSTDLSGAITVEVECASGGPTEWTLVLDLDSEVDLDWDADTWENAFELGIGSDPGRQDLPVDTDRDGLDDVDEALRSTDPLDADSDGDSLPDGAEVEYGSDPLDPDSGFLRLVAGSSEVLNPTVGTSATAFAGPPAEVINPTVAGPQISPFAGPPAVVTHP